MDGDLTVVILAGGLGLRMREYNDTLPKGLIPIGGMPIMEHVIRIYAHFGLKRFIICIGYKGDRIREYCNQRFTGINNKEGIEVIPVDTGSDTPTGGRIKKIEQYIDTDNFFLTYCDGVADINIDELYAHHLKTGKIGTLTAVHPMSPFGIVEVDGDLVSSFKEKPVLPGFISGGYFVFKKDIFKYLNENSILEEEVLKKLAEEKQVAAYRHNKFWACMDTYKDAERLNKLWNTGILPNVDFKSDTPPWKVW